MKENKKEINVVNPYSSFKFFYKFLFKFCQTTIKQQSRIQNRFGNWINIWSSGILLLDPDTKQNI